MKDFGLELGQLIAIPSLGMRRVVGSDDDSKRLVAWAHATEMVDPSPHLRRDELVCTVGASLVNAQNCTRFVEAVQSSDSAGICLGLGEVHTHVPQILRHECERLAVTLVEMSPDVPFLAINDVLVDAKVRARTVDSAREGILLGQLLESLRTGSDVRQLLKLAAETLGGHLSFLAPHDVVVAAGQLGSTATLRSTAKVPIEVLLSENESIQWNPPEDALDPNIVAQVGRIAQIAWREQERRDSEQRQRTGQLFTLVADGLAGVMALLPEIERVGLTGTSLTISAWPAATAPLLALHLPTALIADATAMVFAITGDPVTVHDAAEKLSLVCGYSSPVDASGIARGIIEARATLLLARSRGRVSGPESLTSLTALLEQQSYTRLAPSGLSTWPD